MNYPHFCQSFGPKQEFGSRKTSARELLANLQEAQNAKDFKSYGANVRVVAMKLGQLMGPEVMGYPNLCHCSWLGVTRMFIM